jgi:hypothetical protein
MTNSSSCCGCSSTGVAVSAKSTPEWSASFTSCCWNSSPAGRNETSRCQARRRLAGVRPRDVVGKTRKQHAMELVVDLERINQRKKAAN